MANLAASWQAEWTDDWLDYALPILPNYPVQSAQSYRASILETDAGYVQSFPLQSQGRRRWNGLTWGPLTAAQKTTLMDFFDARTGSLQGFVWTLPTGGDVFAALAESKATATRTGPERYTVTADFIELISPHGDYLATQDRDAIVTQDGDRIILS